MTEVITPPVDDGMTITVSNGYIIRLKRKHLLWSERKVVKGILAKSFVMSGVSMRDISKTKGEALQDSMVSLDPTVNDLATEAIFGFLVEHIKTPDGNTIQQDFVGWLNKQTEQVAEPIFTAFNEATSDLTVQTSGEKNN